MEVRQVPRAENGADIMTRFGHGLSACDVAPRIARRAYAHVGDARRRGGASPHDLASFAVRWRRGGAIVHTCRAQIHMKWCTTNARLLDAGILRFTFCCGSVCSAHCLAEVPGVQLQEDVGEVDPEIVVHRGRLPSECSAERSALRMAWSRMVPFVVRPSSCAACPALGRAGA